MINFRQYITDLQQKGEIYFCTHHCKRDRLLTPKSVSSPFVLPAVMCFIEIGNLTM